jgi:hypothetical protein
MIGRNYLNTAYLPMILQCNGEGTCIYIDGAHGSHADMKGHVGVFATEGKGAMYSSSNKLKLNTISLTETEVVSDGEKLPKSLWYRLFCIAQGGYANEDILMQDNQSAILLQNNGRYSVGKGSKHIDIRYFFITDRIEKKRINVKYCPTEEMIADILPNHYKEHCSTSSGMQCSASMPKTLMNTKENIMKYWKSLI